jgi:hypothetical protein
MAALRQFLGTYRPDRIDPGIDEARDYEVEDLLHVGRLEKAGLRGRRRRVRSGGPTAQLDRRPLLYLAQSGLSDVFRGEKPDKFNRSQYTPMTSGPLCSSRNCGPRPRSSPQS